MGRADLIEWFISLSVIDQLSLYEGRGKLGLDDEPSPITGSEVKGK